MRAMSANIHNSLKDLVGAPGFEPGASCAQGRRATRLRYAPTLVTSMILLHFSTSLPAVITPIIHDAVSWPA
jgi:hypothetical protein